MLEKDHFPELKSLLEKLNSDPAKTKLRQNFVFSATLTFVHEPPQHLVKKRKSDGPNGLFYSNLSVWTESRALQRALIRSNPTNGSQDIPLCILLPRNVISGLPLVGF
jgi:hypothetical protein